MVLINGEVYGGLLPESPSESDWKMGAVLEWKDIPNPPHTFADKRIQYDQDEYKPNTCTIYATIGAISDFFGEEVPLEERKQWIDEAKTLGYDENIGRYVDDAVKLGAKRKNLSYMAVEVDSDDYWEAINRGFTPVTGYKGNQTYNHDRDDDKIVQLNDWGKKTSYAHCIRDTLLSGELSVVDNYFPRKSNVYGLPTLNEKIKSGNLFTWAYFYFTKTTLPMANLPEHIDKDKVATPGAREIVIAWENEMSKWLNDGGDRKRLFSSYTANLPEDELLVVCKMLINLDFIRNS